MNLSLHQITHDTQKISQVQEDDDFGPRGIYTSKTDSEHAHLEQKAMNSHQRNTQLLGFILGVWSLPKNHMKVLVKRSSIPSFVNAEHSA